SGRDAVASREPSSATRISASGNCSRSAATVAPMRSSSSRAATRTTSANGVDRRHQGVVLLAQAVAPGRAALEQQREREAAGPLLEVVHRRETGAAQAGDGGG